MAIETLTIEKTVEVLRSLGMKISPDTLRDGIEQGCFTFGKCVRRRSGGPVYYVYKALLDRWITERSVDDQPDEPEVLRQLEAV